MCEFTLKFIKNTNFPHFRKFFHAFSYSAIPLKNFRVPPFRDNPDFVVNIENKSKKKTFKNELFFFKL